MSRASGILLHPTSLPGPFGIGDLGPSASEFVDLLAEGRQTYWQILPLGPTGYGDSPYQTFSAFAGNPFLISPQGLVDDGFLPAPALDDVPPFPAGEVDYGAVIPCKRGLLERALAHTDARGPAEQRRAIEEFASIHHAWLDDFALFMALKDAHGGRPWTEWEPEIRDREPAALDSWRLRLDREVRLHVFAQYLFFRQWDRLKRYANERGIRIIGDAPIFVAHDSADCWAHRELFYLQQDGQPTLVAGVPPDYFSATGQRWGNPLYRWDVLAAQGYSWWIERLRITLHLVDLLRLDHFRGFAGYWAIPAQAPTAETGTWEPGPGAALFSAVEQALGRLPIIAEDLGVITPDVVELRERFGFPGMKVLQFAFGGDAANDALPHNYTRDCVVYTGTHDNDTTAGWYLQAPAREREHVCAYLGLPRLATSADVVEGLIRLAYASVADTAVIPLQDALGLGSEARMNRPGEPGGNWRWRVSATALNSRLSERLGRLSELYGRVSERAVRADEDRAADRALTRRREP